MELEEAQQTINPTTTTSFTSLPDEIVVSCLAHLSRSYNPQLSLVSKRFNSLISSNNLLLARHRSKTQESFLHVCLHDPSSSLPSWFTLWIKPHQTTLTNDLQKANNSTGNTMIMLVPIIPSSSYSPRVPTSNIGMDGSKCCYTVKQHSISPMSSPLLVRDKESSSTWREVPRMKVARKNPVAGIVDGKIYMMGGCNVDETKNWAEVFDPNTQTWESLPDPGPRLRSSLIKTIYGREGKVYVSNTEKTNYFYDPKVMRWGVAKVALNVERMCNIANVMYAFDDKKYFLWYDTKREEWRVVKGLQILVRNCCDSVIAIANYGGKLLVLWEKNQPNKWYEKNIWCSVIALERRFGDGVCGIVEWASVVLTVPKSYVFLRCQVDTI